MAIAGYKLRINGGAYSNTEIDVGMVYEYLFTGLTPSTEYAVEVASYDDSTPPLQSAWSSVVTATTDAAPELFFVVDDSGNQVTNDADELATIFV